MRVRDALLDDAPVIAEIYRVYVEESVASFEDVAPDGLQMATRMQLTPRLPWLVAEDPAGHIVGYASRHRARAAYRWAVDCSVYVDPGGAGRGIGRLLYSTLLPLLREHGYRRAHAGIALPNGGSVRLHEAMGFLPVGVYEKVGFKFGNWHDVGWWQLQLVSVETASHPPEEPIPWRPSQE